jgi:hypothetical protein
MNIDICVLHLLHTAHQAIERQHRVGLHADAEADPDEAR